MYKKLHIADFRLFQDTDIVFGKYVTVLAGRNSTGKSTILGLVANSAQLQKYRTYSGASFKAEFSELFRGSERFDETAQHRLQLYVELDGAEKSIDFRTAWQKYNEGKRFRIIPKWQNGEGKEVESKLPYPVIYLGLSRLYPVGEAKYGALSSSNTKWDCEEDRRWFVDNYRQILSVQNDIIGVQAIDITGVSRKRGLGVKTSSYDEMANSAGQDNLGQILLALLSFKKLKRDMGGSYPGGLLLIDELDATLHPFAQERVFSLLRKVCRESGIQVVLTTHSVSLLELVCRDVQRNNPDYACGTELYYFIKRGNAIKQCRNPGLDIIKSDLTLNLSANGFQKVGVFSEDAEARYLIGELIKGTSLENRLDFIDCSFGCKQLMQLYAHDFAYMRDRILIFDGDVCEDDIDRYIPKPLRDIGKNIVTLPGETRPEQVIYDFLISYDDEAFWDAAFTRDAFTKDMLVARGPKSEEYRCEANDRNKYKKWFNDYLIVLTQIGTFEAYKKEYAAEVAEFVRDVVGAHNAIAARTSMLAI